MLKLGHFGKQLRNTRRVWTVVLEKDGEDQFDRSCVKHEALHRINEKSNILHSKKKEGQLEWSHFA